jgi:phage-related minor tail protein
MVKSAAKVGAGIAMAMGTAAIAVGGLAVKFTGDLKKALNSVQSQTGTTDDAMVGMKDTMLEIYNANLGESFDDIGRAMAEVNKQTWATGEELKSMTTDALLLRDAFEFEVAESTRTADMMMKQFGITSDEAFNLIAQGAQFGLDKNGNLLDSINEYSVHFKQLGFDADDMFNMLSNGAATGVFDIDKLGDAMKEFGIRSKDGSKASAEGFAALGMDAAKMTAEFAKGGDASKVAFAKVAEALALIKDPVAQNAAGVALFGTMFEDVGVKGVLAMTSTQGEIDKTTDALGKINEVNYDTFGQAVQGIKRNLETGILLPLGEQITPKMNEFANWIIDNMPAIKNEIEFAMGIAEDAITAVGTAITETKEFFEEHWAVVEPIIAGIGAGAITFGVMTAATKAWTLATGLATKAQAALNLVMNLNPMAKVAILIGALVTAGVTLYRNWDTIKLKAGELWVAIENAFIRGVNAAIGLINKLIRQINKIPGVDVPLVANVELKTTTTGDVGHNATGTDYWRGGLTWVGEQGPELINLPRGAQVFPHGESMAMAGGGGVTVNINGANIMDDYGVDRLMNRVMDRLALKGVR